MLLKLVSAPEDASSISLAEDLGWSQSQAHRSLKRAEAGHLISIAEPPSGRSAGVRRLNRRALYELVAFGVPYVFPAELGRLERGVPTAGSAPVLAERFASDPEPIVWPDAEGDVRGMSLLPLHPSVPMIAREDPELYELLALVDAVRVGRAREREIAREELRNRLL